MRECASRILIDHVEDIRNTGDLAARKWIPGAGNEPVLLEHLDQGHSTTARDDLLDGVVGVVETDADDLRFTANRWKQF